MTALVQPIKLASGPVAVTDATEIALWTNPKLLARLKGRSGFVRGASWYDYNTAGLVHPISGAIATGLDGSLAGGKQVATFGAGAAGLNIAMPVDADYTIVTVFKVPAAGSKCVIGTTTNAATNGLFIDGGVLQFGQNGPFAGVSGTPLTIGAYVVVTAAYSQATKVVTFRVNGAAYGTLTFTTGNKVTTWQVGRFGASGNQFVGQIADVMVLNENLATDAPLLAVIEPYLKTMYGIA